MLRAGSAEQTASVEDSAPQLHWETKSHMRTGRLTHFAHNNKNIAGTGILGTADGDVRC